MIRAISLLVAFAALLEVTRPTAVPQSASEVRRIVGTWTLVSLERSDRRGNWIPIGNPRGILIHDAKAHVIQIVTRGGRQASESAIPTPVEAQEIYESFSGFWGSYTVDDKRATVSYRPLAAVDPGQVDKPQVFSIDMAGNRLSMTSQLQAPMQQIRAIWERVPDLEALSPSHQRLVGFWQWVSEERVSDNGSVLRSTKRDSSTIAYSPAGYVAVHFPPAARRSFAGSAATPEEALAAITGYVSYFGPYVLQPEHGYVLHHRLAVLNPPGQTGDTLQRFFELSDSQLVLRFPPVTDNGQTARNVVTLKRLSSLTDMQ